MHQTVKPRPTPVNTDRPGGPDHPGQQSPLLLQTELHDSWSLKLLSDPLALLHVVDEHELHPNVLTVGQLRDRQTLSSWVQCIQKGFSLTYTQYPITTTELFNQNLAEAPITLDWWIFCFFTLLRNANRMGMGGE